MAERSASSDSSGPARSSGRLLFSGPLLAELPEKIRSSLLDEARKIECAPNTRLCTEGETATQLFLISKGSVSYSQVIPNGQQTILFWFRPGDSFGLGALLGKAHPYMGTATSV